MCLPAKPSPSGSWVWVISEINALYFIDVRSDPLRRYIRYIMSANAANTPAFPSDHFPANEEADAALKRLRAI